MWLRASSGVRSRPSRPITTPTSSSKSSACEPGGAATGSPDPTAACGLPYRYVGCSYQAAIACSAFPVIVAAPWTCSSKATKSRNDAGRTGDRSRTRSDDTISITSSSDGAVRAVAAVSRSVPTGNSRTVATKMSSALTTPTRSWPSTSTRAYLTVRLLPPDRSDVDDGREGPLAPVQHRDRLAERVLLEVRVRAVLLEGVLVVVDLEDLEDRRLVGVLVDDVGLAAGLFARRRREGGERLADDVLLAGHDGVLDGHAAAGRQRRRGRVGRVADQQHPAAVPRVRRQQPVVVVHHDERLVGQVLAQLHHQRGRERLEVLPHDRAGLVGLEEAGLLRLVAT